jgi:hypothetical protein
MGQENQGSKYPFLKDLVFMRQILVLILFSLGPAASLAHPGKTDYQDAHRCLKNCEEWDLDYGEYHLHDKDRNPIRIGSKKVSVKERIPQEETVSAQKPLPILSAPEHAARIDSLQDVSVRTSDLGKVIPLPAREEGAFQFRDIMLIIIAGLLIMVLFILRRRKGAG